MKNTITGFKLLKGGMAGIEVEGIDLVASGNDRVMFRDGLKRTRKFPLSLDIRNAVAVLNYPFLVGTLHWKQEYSARMKPDFSSPNFKDSDVNEQMFRSLNSLWTSTQIIKCTLEKGNYKLTGEISCPMCTVKATVSVAPDSDYSLYSYVQESINTILELLEKTLNLPQAALGSGDQIRELYSKIATDKDEEMDEVIDPDAAFLMLMQTASKKGYGIVLDDNMLGQLSEGITDEDGEEGVFMLEAKKEETSLPEEISEDDLKAQEQFEQDLAEESLSDRAAERQEAIKKVLGKETAKEGPAEVKSMQTADDGLFGDAEEHNSLMDYLEEEGDLI